MVQRNDEELLVDEDGTRVVGEPGVDMTPEEFRRWGHEAVDWLADYLDSPEFSMLIIINRYEARQETIEVELTSEPEAEAVAIE